MQRFYFVVFAFLFVSLPYAYACKPPTQCQSDSQSCSSVCGPGNPAANANVTPDFLGHGSANNSANALSQAGSMQQGALSQANAACDAAKQKAMSSCQSDIAANQDPKCSSQKQQAEQSKQKCEAAAGAFKSKTGSDKAASDMMKQLAEMAKGLMQKPPSGDKKEEEKKKPTECERYADRIKTEKDLKRRTAIQNIYNKKCAMAKRKAGLTNTQPKSVRGAPARREEGGTKKVGNLEISEKESYIRHMLKCEEGGSLTECCSKPENQRFCQSQQAIGETAADDQGGSTGSSTLSSASRKPRSKTEEKINDREIGGGNDPKKAKLEISEFEAGGGGAAFASGSGYNSSGDENGYASVPKPTQKNVKTAAALEKDRKQIANKGHDMFSAVTKQIRKAYMKGNLIQSQDVLFKRY